MGLLALVWEKVRIRDLLGRENIARHGPNIGGMVSIPEDASSSAWSYITLYKNVT